jgi:hypothetical protein
MNGEKQYFPQWPFFTAFYHFFSNLKLLHQNKSQKRIFFLLCNKFQFWWNKLIIFKLVRKQP